ncbi:hypothetical protein SBDP1_40047 [Syntrophobacter sp. SbD1]|nr:hypothetical protein SBDP1_40047 [Syntrophobacter sp. SbD1]
MKLLYRCRIPDAGSKQEPDSRHPNRLMHNTSKPRTEASRLKTTITNY